MSGLAEILEENRRLRELAAGLVVTLRSHDVAVRERDEAIRQRDQLLSRKDTELKAAADRLSLAEEKRRLIQARVDELEHAFAVLQGKKPASQRFVDDGAQIALPMFPDIAAPPRAAIPKADDEPETPKRRLPSQKKGQPRRRTREDFSHLTSRTVYCPADPNTTCACCGGALRIVGKATSFRIGWVPGHYVVDDVVRDKCMCDDCPGQGVLTVPAPYALDKALCTDSLLARVLVDKFADHLPLNRQAARMAREGFEVNTGTLSGWVLQACGLLRVVSDAVRADALRSSFLQGDDTGMPVQDGTDGKLRRGRFWVFTDQQQAFYRFTDTKEGQYPAELLAGFTGDCLLVDGGSEFNQVTAERDLKRGGCWSHLRTYFFKALAYHPHECRLALGTLRDLFLLERPLVRLPADERLAARQETHPVLIDGFFTWMRALSAVARPSSKLMEALTYGLNQEDRLRLCLKRGDIPIHNNLSELLLRQPVVGRKNWLFAGTEGGAEAAATMFTLIGSCRLQGIDPEGYLCDILGRIQEHPARHVEALTPRGWAPARAPV